MRTWKRTLSTGKVVWDAALDLGAENGRRRRAVRRGFATKKAAESWASDVRARLDKDQYIEPSTMTVEDYLMQRWIPEARSQVRPRTAARYEELLRVHVVPRIGRVPLSKLRPLHVQDVKDAMIDGGSAPRTAAHCYRVLHSALGQAVRWQLLAVNPATAINPPKVGRSKPTVPDPETVGRILTVVENTPYHVPLLLAAACGLRRGETLGLRWRAVDLDAGTLRVEEALQVVGKEMTFVEPKTDRGRRTISLPPVVVGVLRRHRKNQAERRLRWGQAWQDLDLVCDRGDGGPIPPPALSQAFRRTTKRLGVTARLHDLRHFFASTLLRGGVHPKIASEVLGHSSTSFTMDVYQHLTPGMGETAAEAVQASLGTVIGDA